MMQRTFPRISQPSGSMIPGRMASRRKPRSSPLPHLEGLEPRTLLSIASSELSPMTWVSVGPNPINPSATPLPPAPEPDSFGGLGPDPIGVVFPGTGRITGIAPSPTDPNTIYVAAAGGGVWKTTNGGSTWAALTDNQATLNMGSIALAPSNPSIIYAGTGEASTPFFDSFPGRGILKSTNAGASWTLLGQSVFDRRSIAKIVVDPASPDIVFAAVADFANGAVAGNTGIWKSTNGGATWTNTTSATVPGDAFVDMVMDPSNSQVVYAAAANPAGNALNSVYKTTDGGLNWAVSGNFPVGGNEGRISLAIAPTHSNIVYAAVADTSNSQLLGVYQTTNSGSSWTALAGIPNFAGGQAFYDLSIGVDPTDASGNTFYAAGQAGANSFIRVVVTPGSPPTTAVQDISGGTNSPHADHHVMAFDAANHLLEGNDGGIWRLETLTPALTWANLNGNLGITEFVGVALDPSATNIAYGGSQDNGSEKYTGSTTWTAIAGGDGGFVRVDQANHATVYHEFYGTNLVRSTDSGATFPTNITPPGATGGLFYVPYILDPSNSKRMLYGTATLYQTTDATAGTPTWTSIGVAGTNGFNTGGSNIVSIAIAKSHANTIYVTTGSQIFSTTNAGASWTNVSIPSFGSGITDLQVDPFNSQVVYAVRAKTGNGKLFRSGDGGTTWTNISSDLPDEVARSLVIDPRTTPETLYLGNDIGVYASFNQGGSWVRYGSGMPNVQVKQLELQLNNGVNLLGAATYGRGLFEIKANNPLVVTPIAFTGAVEASHFTNTEVATFTDPTNPVGIDPSVYYAATITWGDGSSTAGQITRDAAGVLHVTGAHTYAEEGTSAVTTLIMSEGGSSGGGTATVTIADAPLSSSNGTEITGIEGITTGSILLGSFSDANPGATIADYTTPPGSITVDWGDGSPPQTLDATNLTLKGSPNGMIFLVRAAHTYSEAGTYAYTVTVVDDGGATTAFGGSAIIADAPLTAAQVQPTITTTEATLFPVPVFAPPLFSGAVASFTDANTVSSSIRDFMATIDWGDGTPLTAGRVVADATAGSYTVTGKHTYADSAVNGGTGTFTIQVFVIDVDGAKTTITNTASVDDRLIPLSGHLNTASDSGWYKTDKITNIDQPNFLGHSEPFSHVTLFANGVVVGAAQAGSDGSWSITCDPLADGTYNITATAMDQFGITSTAAPVSIEPTLLIDTVGPRITFSSFDPGHSRAVFLFQDLLADGTTPGGSGLLYRTLFDSANYQLVKLSGAKPGDHVVTSIQITPGPNPLSQKVVVFFNGGASNKKGNFDLIAKAMSVLTTSGIQDVAGNALDGEYYGKKTATGNGVAGGNYQAAFSLNCGKSLKGPGTVIGIPHPSPAPGTSLASKPVKKAASTSVKPKSIVAAVKPTASLVLVSRSTSTAAPLS